MIYAARYGFLDMRGRDSTALPAKNACMPLDNGVAFHYYSDSCEVPVVIVSGADPATDHVMGNPRETPIDSIGTGGD